MESHLGQAALFMVDIELGMDCVAGGSNGFDELIASNWAWTMHWDDIWSGPARFEIVMSEFIAGGPPVC